MALEARITHSGLQRVVLEEYPWGVYVMAYRPNETGPCRDHLQDNWQHARLQALEDYGVSDDMWREIPDTGIMR